MSVLERLNAAVDSARTQGLEILEIDLTNADYSDLLLLAAAYDEPNLNHLELDLVNQRYRGYKMGFGPEIAQSDVILEDGIELLPSDEAAKKDKRVTTDG